MANTEAPKVVSLNGAKIKAPYEPRPAVVDHLERLLEAARNGEVIGVAVVCVHGDDATSSAISGQKSRAMLGTLDMMKADLCDELRWS